MTDHSRPRLGGRQQWADTDLAKSIAPHREFGTHKWDVGGVVVIAGSPMYTGAAQLCTRAAGRAGAGIVHLAAPRSVIAVIASAIPEVAYVPLPGVDTALGVRTAMETLSVPLKRARATVVGPGLGDDNGTADFLSALFGLRQGARNVSRAMGFTTVTPIRDRETGDDLSVFGASDATVVVDADALNWLAQQPEWWTRVPKGRLILTPHPGEMGRLLGREPDELLEDPIATVEEAARLWGQTVVFKVGYTAASDGDRTVVAEDAPVSLATAGSGDVLAGAIGAFAAQGLAPIDAAALALHVGPRAARRGEQRYGAYGLISTDLPEAIALELAALTDD